MILPYLAAITVGLMLWGLYKRDEILPFWCAVILFLCAYIGFVISIYPYVIPFQTTLWQAAAPDSSLRFLLFGVIIMLPILLIYTGYSYHIFKGKVKNVFEY
jgi:cytochrome bd ubiquinol oxidase subunit II